MKQPSKMILRLCKKIKDEIGFDCNPYTFKRTYAGYWQRGLGAWSWSMQTKGGIIDVGSADRASECVKRKYKLVKLERSTEIVAVLKKEEKENG